MEQRRLRELEDEKAKAIMASAEDLEKGNTQEIEVPEGASLGEALKIIKEAKQKKQ